MQITANNLEMPAVNMAKYQIYQSCLTASNFLGKKWAHRSRNVGNSFNSTFHAVGVAYRLSHVIDSLSKRRPSLHSATTVTAKTRWLFVNFWWILRYF